MAVTQAQLTELYLAYFGRPPDFDGISFYTSNPAFTMTSVAAAFSASPESQAMYGTVFGAAQINAIYQNLFNRDAEPAGLSYWATEVNAGRITPAGAALAILQGAQNDDKTSVDNKLAIATAFIAELDTATEIIGYSGPVAAASARAFLHTVDSTAGSVTSATANLDAAVDTAVGLGGPAGQVFTLSVTKDTITGTAGNDTIDAIPDGGNTTTINSFDSIDGGAGTDTLNIYTGEDSSNTVQVGTVKNVEHINIYQEDNSFGDGQINAAGFQGATQIWQFGAAVDVENVSNSTVIGLSGVENFGYFWVDGTATATELNVALDGVGDGDGWGGRIIASGDALTTVNLTGTLAADEEPSEAPFVSLYINSGDDVESVSVNSAVGVYAHVNGGDVTSFDASGSSGDITFDGYASVNSGAGVTSIKTGAGDDYVNVTTATLADDVLTAAVDPVSADVSTGAGDDDIDVGLNRSMAGDTGAVTIDAGAGDDSVWVYTRSTGKLTVNLGDGDDEFTTQGATVAGTDAIDGGAGTDGLLLSLVGSSNIAAFSNFETFDAYGLSHALDVDILASKNTVTEIVTSGDVGGSASLTNLGAGVGFRATGSTASVLTLSQKVGGALTVTSDIDQAAAAADTVADATGVAVTASNATGLTAVFANDFVDKVTSTITLIGTKATTLSIDSGGTHSSNVIAYHSSVNATTDLGNLATVTVTGAAKLTLNLDDGTNDVKSGITKIDASAMTGNLTTDLANLKNGGTLLLGTGADLVTVGVESGATTMESISGFEKAVAAAFGTSPTPSIADSDKLAFATATQVTATDAVADGNGTTVSKGVLSFAGTGPQTLTQAMAFADAQLAAAGDLAVFTYIGDTYVYVQGADITDVAADDIVVKLTGVTGVTQVAEDGSTNAIFLG